jgi:DNA repair/transcription protein MET18/MMS19
VFDNPLAAFQDQLSEVLSQALMGTAKEEVSFRVTALKGLLRLSILRKFFQDNEIGLFVQYLDEILLKEESVGRDDLKKEAIAALAEISKYKPRLIMDITFPAFVATLPDSAEDTKTDYMITLESLAQISVEKDIFETLVRRLLNKFDLLLQREDAGSVTYPRALLLTILYVMGKRKLEGDQNLGSYYERITVGLCRKAASAASGNTPNKILNDAGVLDTLGRLCNLITRALPREKQDEIAENVYSLFSSAETFKPVPFAESVSDDQRRTLILSTYLLAGLPKDSTKLPYTDPDTSSLLRDLVKLAVAEREPAIHLALLRQLALLVNKFLPNAQLSLASDILNSLLPSKTEDKQLGPETIKTIFWLSKALVLRLAPTTTELLTSLLSLLSSSDQTTSTTAARSFALLLSSDEVLSADNGANIRLLSKQRVFSTVVPLISTNIRALNTSDDTSAANIHIKPAYLTALSGILSTIPPSLVMPELPTLLPLLLQSLDLKDETSQPVKAATLETLAVIIRENGVRVIDDSGHIQSLVTRLLKTAEYVPGQPATNNHKLRAQALRCLYLLAHTPGEAPAIAKAGKVSPLLPVKNQVVRSLRLILDDPKRDVRKAAVDARGAWLHEVDDEPEDED